MPQIVLIAGPNGAGKSTAAPSLLARLQAYLNADEIAKQLRTSGLEKPDMQAGRQLLLRWEELERQRADFAVETTLATRSFAPRIEQMRRQGYRFHLLFLWLPSADYAMERVQERVRHGGHSIPEGVIRRRYVAGLQNFFALYRPLADTWRMYDNSSHEPLALIARGRVRIEREELWQQIVSQWA